MTSTPPAPSAPAPPRRETPQSERDLLAVPTAALVDLVDPMGTPAWSGARPFTVADVQAVLDSPRRHRERILASEHQPLGVHLARIAHLVETWANDGSDPVEVEVDAHGSVTVVDGHHRLCAAHVRAEQAVVVSLAGFVDLAAEAFGLTPAS